MLFLISILVLNCFPAHTLGIIMFSTGDVYFLSPHLPLFFAPPSFLHLSFHQRSFAFLKHNEISFYKSLAEYLFIWKCLYLTLMTNIELIHSAYIYCGPTLCQDTSQTFGTLQWTKPPNFLPLRILHSRRQGRDNKQNGQTKCLVCYKVKTHIKKKSRAG